MSIILFDDDFNTIGVEIPPYTSLKRDISIVDKWSVDLPVTNENKVREVLEYIKLRNQTLTFNNQTNINGRLVGDYTCAISLNGRQFYGKITVTSDSNNSTRHYHNGIWQKDGATVSLSIEEVTA